ncbi:ankyrin repeat-containing domain protein [Trichoderma sp. SZMC 28012]
MASKPLSYNDYSVGWICALSEERTAATAMLDERHDSLPISNPSDTNSYTLGAIGKHNVVVVCLPEGEIGTNSAASVIMQLVTTFPSIKFGLLVGIGGGIPPRVRLGDIVVSTPVGEYPGVVQWDLGKATKTSFVRTGSLDRPPKALLSALTMMKTNHEMEGHKISQLLEELARKWPRLASKYTWNDRLKDTAFEEENTDDKRSPNDPRIHYGLIASGNQVIKDGSTRDKINARLGGQVLCVEMEAAGVMNNFPCLVIRGICDYADSKKNDDWREYAASIAAAFAKELLQIVRPTQIEGEPSARDILNQVCQSVGHIQLQVDKQEEKQILDWLTPIDYGLIHSDYYKRLQPGTGKWFLEQKEFQDWITGNNGTLFCYGIPGAGKTILASLIINRLSSRFRGSSDIGITYVYFNYNKQEDQDFQKLLASLLKQLAGGLHYLPESTKQLYDEHSKKRTRASLEEIITDLTCVITSYSEVFIILDALDECPFFELHLFLSRLFELQRRYKIKILTTSRPIPEIMDLFNHSNVAKLQIRAETSDVTKCIEAQMDRLPKVARESPALWDEIKAGISEAADGMFLLAQIYLVLLQDKMTLNDIRRQLVIFKSRNTENTSGQKGKTLTYAYEQAIERIRDQKEGISKLAMRALAWVTLAKRQITTLELQHALATQGGMTTLSHDDLPDLSDITSACVGLLTIDEQSHIIRLVHYTAHEYLEETQNSWFPSAEESIMRSCLTYLSFEIFNSGHCQSDEAFEHRIESFPLFHYAANHWECHLSHDTEVIEDVIHFLESQTSVEASMQARFTEKQHPLHQKYSQDFPSNMTGLHAAAVLGLTEATKLLLERGCDPGAMDSYNYTPVSWASFFGHEVVVELLVIAGANLEVRDLKNERTPLMWAAARGHEAVVKLLLEQGSDINAQDCVGQTPLSIAARYEHKTIIELLRQSGGTIDDEDTLGYLKLVFHDGAIPSWMSPSVGKSKSRDVTQNAEDSCHNTPETGSDVDVDEDELMESDVDLNEKDDDGRTPLSLAAEFGQRDLIQSLIETGEVNLDEADDETGMTPLHWAVVNGHPYVVELLTNAGAQLEIEEKEYQMTALGLAVHHKQMDVYRGADINARTPDGLTVLYPAIERGYFDVIRLLVERGADITATCDGLTPLLFAITTGKIDIIRLLTKIGADINIRGEGGLTPLIMSTGLGHTDNIQPLIDLGANINARDNDGHSPLFFAIIAGNIPTIELLVGMDYIDLNKPDARGITPIVLATLLERHDIVKLLLQSGKITMDDS